MDSEEHSVIVRDLLARDLLRHPGVYPVQLRVARDSAWAERVRSGAGFLFHRLHLPDDGGLGARRLEVAREEHHSVLVDHVVDRHAVQPLRVDLGALVDDRGAVRPLAARAVGLGGALHRLVRLGSTAGGDEGEHGCGDSVGEHLAVLLLHPYVADAFGGPFPGAVGSKSERGSSELFGLISLNSSFLARLDFFVKEHFSKEREQTTILYFTSFVNRV